MTKTKSTITLKEAELAVKKLKAARLAQDVAYEQRKQALDAQNEATNAWIASEKVTREAERLYNELMSRLQQEMLNE